MKNTQKEQVIEAMRKNGGYATFGQLNNLIDFSSWKTETPQASVRRIVQKSDAFFRIRPGLWALKQYKQEILGKFQLENEDKEQEFTHSFYQGLIVEIGNLIELHTYVPAQDKNKLFLDKPLKDLVTQDKIYEFTYPEILRRAKTVDVVWFNDRKLPNSFFEIEHTTDFRNSLTKFFELQDYYAHFCIVAPQDRKRQFEDIMKQSIFKPIRERVVFVNYDDIAELHSKMNNLFQTKTGNPLFNLLNLTSSPTKK